ncbi:C6 finger domain [Mycena sanguinolenta]|uniref:C6 finger domain n=1 Tax=Mycena sanguinolenta TaxID=230812 RepID=A0A8H7D214_9AGAR|nr:C6 finger domain [Mycena sanguinolenta]
MSTSKHTGRPQQNDVPLAVQRRRTIMACVNCRRRKMRCITPEQPPKNPCARCTKKGLLCEYVPADQDDDSYSPDSALAESSWEAPPIPALPLPYTSPPATEHASQVFWLQLPRPIAVWIAIHPAKSTAPILWTFANQHPDVDPGTQSPGRTQLPVYGEL